MKKRKKWNHTHDKGHTFAFCIHWLGWRVFFSLLKFITEKTIFFVVLFHRFPSFFLLCVCVDNHERKKSTCFYGIVLFLHTKKSVFNIYFVYASIPKSMIYQFNFLHFHALLSVSTTHYYYYEKFDFTNSKKRNRLVLFSDYDLSLSMLRMIWIFLFLLFLLLLSDSVLHNNKNEEQKRWIDWMWEKRD